MGVKYDKRFLDIVLSCCAILVLSPFLLVICILELIYHGRPIFRRFSIDELGGLFNILNGTMSIIGPRPLMVDYLPLYNERHKYRHAVRPGLACWDLRKGNELTSASFTWNVQFENDIYYVENVSLWLDIKQVFKTIQLMLTKSEMRTNSDRVKFNGQNLNETRTRSQIIAEEGEEGIHTPPKYIVEDRYL